jgi:hypothetical protein
VRHARRRTSVSSLLAACVCASAFAFGGTPQQKSIPERVLELNRNGEWGEAARLAQNYLISATPKPPAERCLAYFGLASAQARLGRTEDARATLEVFDKECPKLPSARGLADQVARLRAEMSAPPASLLREGDGFWQTADPSALGMNVRALTAHSELCLSTGADACLVVHKGRIVRELYSARYREPIYAMSSTKSITGLLVGMLIDDGKIKSVDEPVCAFVREWCEGRKGQVTIRHLLTMTSGLPRMYEEGVASTNDKNAFVVALAPAHEPGTRWDYSNEGVQLLEPILDKAAGEPIQDYARKRLFEPLGMRDTRLHLDEKNHAWTYADMETTPRDFARIGL